MAHAVGGRRLSAGGGRGRACSRGWKESTEKQQQGRRAKPCPLPQPVPGPLPYQLSPTMLPPAACLQPCYACTCPPAACFPCHLPPAPCAYAWPLPPGPSPPVPCVCACPLFWLWCLQHWPSQAQSCCHSFCLTGKGWTWAGPLSALELEQSRR